MPARREQLRQERSAAQPRSRARGRPTRAASADSPPGPRRPDPERGRGVEGTGPRHPGHGGEGGPVSLTTAPRRSPSSGPGEGR